MKKLLFFIPLIFLVQACPLGLDYSLTELGTEQINQNLIGIWKNNNPDGEVQKVEFMPGEKNSLNVRVIERGEMYGLETDDLIAYQTVLNGKTFLILKPSDEDKYYHYQFEVKGDKLFYNDMSLLDGGVDAVTSIESLRDQVARSMEKEEWAKEKYEMSRVR